jgi:probable rRNA maturation factor
MRGAQVPAGRITFYYRPDLGGWRLRPAGRYKIWLREGLALEGVTFSIGHIAYTFVAIPEMQALHERLFRESTPTDVITLDYREAVGAPLLAEIFVCPMFIRASAQALRLSYGEELRRVLAHALLHLLGYRDDTPEARLRMRLAEERWLALWKPLSCVSHETSRV